MQVDLVGNCQTESIRVSQLGQHECHRGVQSNDGRHQQLVRTGLTEDLFRSTIVGEATAEKLGEVYASGEEACKLI